MHFSGLPAKNGRLRPTHSAVCLQGDSLDQRKWPSVIVHSAINDPTNRAVLYFDCVSNASSIFLARSNLRRVRSKMVLIESISDSEMKLSDSRADALSKSR